MTTSTAYPAWKQRNYKACVTGWHFVIALLFAVSDGFGDSRLLRLAGHMGCSIINDLIASVLHRIYEPPYPFIYLRTYVSTIRLQRLSDYKVFYSITCEDVVRLYYGEGQIAATVLGTP